MKLLQLPILIYLTKLYVSNHHEVCQIVQNTSKHDNVHL
jgi:hypothetical protein